MKRLIIVPILLLSCYSYSQVKKNCKCKNVIISGYISDSTLKKSDNKIDLILYENYNTLLQEKQDTIQLIIKNNTFSASFKANAETVYFAVKGGSLYLNSIDKKPFLAQSGDSLYMDIKNLNEVVFSGNGADKLNFQTWAYKVILGEIQDYIKALKDKEGLGVIDYSKQYATKSLGLAIDKLNKISGNWGSEIKSILKLNIISAINMKFVENITMPLAGRDSLYSKAVHNEIGYLLYQQAGFVRKAKLSADESFLYSQYLYGLNRFYYITENNKYPFKHFVRNDSASRFSLVFNNIKIQYSGLLRDQLMVLIFQKLKMFNSDDAIDFLQEAISLTRDRKSKEVLELLKTKKMPGSKAYPFSVEGFKTKQIKLTDFKGKIVVIDTYYNGCYPCTVLAEKMEPIIEYFKDRNDVVFLSIDALSKDRKKFEDGVERGIYGSQGSVYGWVGIMADRHPLLRFYNYTGYPNLLIVDKNGEVIATDPIKPFNEKAKKEFIQMLERYL